MSRGPRLDVRIRGRTPAPLTEAAVRALALRALAPLFPRGPVECGILFCGDTRMRAINRTWRGRDATTDVLSFPMGDIMDGRLSVGDIIISRPKAKSDARRDGMTLAEKVDELLTHGLLHLAGYDHETPADARRMDARARSLRAARKRGKHA